MTSYACTSLINHTLGQWSLYNLELHSVPGSEVGTPPQRVLAAPDTIARPKENLSAPNQKIIVPRAFIFTGSRSINFYVPSRGRSSPKTKGLSVPNFRDPLIPKIRQYKIYDKLKTP